MGVPKALRSDVPNLMKDVLNFVKDVPMIRKCIPRWGLVEAGLPGTHFYPIPRS